MDDTTKKLFLTIGAGLLKKAGIAIGMSVATHGWISGDQVELFGAAAVALGSAGYSFWNDYGKAIVLSQLDVLKAKSLAQAAKLNDAGLAPVTVGQIAAQSPTLTATDVVKTVATLPASIQANVAPTVVKVLIAAFLLSAFLAGGHEALAQTPRPKARPSSVTMPVTGDALPCDPANLLPGCKDTGVLSVSSSSAGSPLTKLLSKPMNDLANFIMAGFDDAVTLSVAVPELQDGNGQACWSMMRNYSAVLKQHPIPITLHAASDLEAIRLLNMAANRICQNAACTQVFTDAGNLVNAAMPLGMPLPDLTSICSKIPAIAIVSPSIQASQPSPAPSPIPSPTP